MLWPLIKIPDPPIRHENEIQAMYMQMRNWGQFYIPQLGGPIISIDEWRERELARIPIA